jgi:hypothetical protein
MRPLGFYVAATLTGLLSLYGCVTQTPSGTICQPAQQVRCNDCPTLGERGWAQCSSDGQSLGACTQCSLTVTNPQPIPPGASTDPGSSGSGGSFYDAGFRAEASVAYDSGIFTTGDDSGDDVSSIGEDSSTGDDSSFTEAGDDGGDEAGD